MHDFSLILLIFCVGNRVFVSDVILTLASKASLKDCRKEAEYRIFELINGDTDRLLSRTSFQWYVGLNLILKISL
jgi:hypothetical protein